MSAGLIPPAVIRLCQDYGAINRPPLQQRAVASITQFAINDSGCRSEWMRLGFIRVDDMHHFDTTNFQEVGNQCAMTTPPNSFRAHEGGGAGLFCELDKAIYAFA